MKLLEKIVGISTFISIVLGTVYTYYYDIIFPKSVLFAIIGGGSIWVVLNLWNIYNWWKAEKLFFTKAYRFTTMFTFVCIIGVLLFINMQYPHNLHVNFRYVIAFSFFLMIIANIKNFINFEDSEVIQFQDKGIAVKWRNLEHISLENQVFRFVTNKGKVYEVLLQDIDESRQAAFQTQIKALINRHDLDITLRHLITESE